LAVYAFLPRLPTPGSLGRLAAVLSGDPRFEPETAWVWELPRPLAGYAVVNAESGDVTPAVPEGARGALAEVGRALEELAARRPAVALALLYNDLEELLWLQDWLRKRGVTSFTLRALVGGESVLASGAAEAVAVELRPPKPMGSEELRKLVEEGQEEWLGSLVGETEAEALERLGLGALAWLAPRRCWVRVRREGGWEECVFTLNIAMVIPLPPLRLLDVRIEGSRGAAGVEGEYVYAKLRSLDSELLPLAEEAAEAAGELGERLSGWNGLLRTLRWEEYQLIGAAPLAEAAERGEARVWREGGRIRVWLPPETAARIETLRGGLRSYLRALSERLGVEVELAERGEPPLVSPEVDEAHRRLVAALKGLVGASP
jgi:hypothetical protein